MLDKGAQHGLTTLRGFGVEARNVLAVSLVISIVGAVAVVVGVAAYRDHNTVTRSPP